MLCKGILLLIHMIMTSTQSCFDNTSDIHIFNKGTKNLEKLEFIQINKTIQVALVNGPSVMLTGV